MKAAAVCIVSLLAASVAHAQPGMQSPLVLTDDDADLLEHGEISNEAHIGGGIGALLFGFGIGQAVQGRWSRDGWMFTLGDSAAGGVFMVGLVQTIATCFGEPGGPSHRCSEDTSPMMWGGLIALGVLRVWQTADAFGVPPRHNERVRALRQRLGLPPPMPSYSAAPYVAPAGQGGGGVAGLALHF
jgi:hypothetical protein